MGCSSSKETPVSDAKADARTAASVAPTKAAASSDRHEKTFIEKKTTEVTDSIGVSNTTSHTVIEAIHGETSMTESTKTTVGEAGMVLGKFRLRYACVSRRGRDPDDTSKPNQDSYSVHCKFAETSTDSFFGVYDGHGPKGDQCSQFVQQRLPSLFAQKISEHDEFVLATKHIHTSLHEAHTQCNDEIHESVHIDDSVSGTTSITLYVEGEAGRITISNVGDSRAILGTQTHHKMQAVPLSKDHTPYRADEAERCKRSGARILSFGEISGNVDPDDDSEDPPRVWAMTGKYPGTAFTRSIGDSRADQLGVIAEPEMLTLKISENEKIIVLASDGIFDVLSNQQVIDICFQHYGNDPIHACMAVIEKSHEEWLKNEECIGNEASASFDDMTIACIFIGEGEDVKDNGSRQQKDGIASSMADSALASVGESTGEAQPKRKRTRQKTLRNLEEGFGSG